MAVVLLCSSVAFWFVCWDSSFTIIALIVLIVWWCCFLALLLSGLAVVLLGSSVASWLNRIQIAFAQWLLGCLVAFFSLAEISHSVRTH